MTEDLIIRFAKAYIIHALSECSDYSRKFWSDAFHEIVKIQQEHRLKLIPPKGDAEHEI